MKILCSICLLAFCLSGCALIDVAGGPMTVDQKATLIKSAARTGTYFALTEVYKDDEAKMKEKAAFIKQHISSLSVASPVTSDKIYAAFVAHVPPEYALLMQNAIDVFSLYFVVDTEDVLNEDNLTLIAAFCLGVIEGCDIILNQ